MGLPEALFPMEMVRKVLANHTLEHVPPLPMDNGYSPTNQHGTQTTPICRGSYILLGDPLVLGSVLICKGYAKSACTQELPVPTHGGKPGSLFGAQPRALAGEQRGLLAKSLSSFRSFKRRGLPPNTICSNEVWIPKHGCRHVR